MTSEPEFVADQQSFELFCYDTQLLARLQEYVYGLTGDINETFAVMDEGLEAAAKSWSKFKSYPGVDLWTSVLQWLKRICYNKKVARWKKTPEGQEWVQQKKQKAKAAKEAKAAAQVLPDDTSALEGTFDKMADFERNRLIKLYNDEAMLPWIEAMTTVFRENMRINR